LGAQSGRKPPTDHFDRDALLGSTKEIAISRVECTAEAAFQVMSQRAARNWHLNLESLPDVSHVGRTCEHNRVVVFASLT
jgi:hypothetical protein